MKNKPTLGIITILLGILVSLIPVVIFPVCTNMIELQNGKSIFMKCHWSAMAELFIGILIIIVGILTIIFKNHETRLSLSIMLFFLGLTVLLIPTIFIGMCETATMACRVGTEPSLIVISLITMVVGIVSIFSQISSIKKEGQ